MKTSASRVAHDLNSQIMILLNSLDRMAAFCPEDEETAMALRAAKECAALVSQLLPTEKLPRKKPRSPRALQ